jgi:hypothetical protein
MVDLKDPEQQRLLRQAFGEAIDSWLDKKFAQLGRWSLGGMAAVIFAAVVYLYFSSKGFTK